MTDDSDSTQVGPVIFSDDTAHRQLISKAEVVTFRTDRRTTGTTWWRTSRTGPKRGDCHIDMIEPVDASNDDELEPHLHLSGFDTVKDWQTAIESLNGTVGGGFLYHVHLLSTIDNDSDSEVTQ